MFVSTLVVSQAPTIALCFAAFGAWSPLALLRWRQRQRGSELREVWPEIVDNLASAVRAGLSLPEAIAQIGVRGPEVLRPPFVRFGQDYRTSGRFDESIDRLKATLADPVGDRIIESVRMAREVGGSDLGRLLRTLSSFLREDARTRAELETRQGWTVNAARLALAAPWLMLGLLSLRPEAVRAYNSASGVVVLLVGGGALAGRLPCHAAHRPAAHRAAGAAMTPAAVGAVLGATTAGGVIVAVRAAPPFRRPRLDSRLAPYVSDTARPSRLIDESRVVTPFPTLERLLRPFLADAVRLLERVLGGAGSVRRRLEQAGLPTTVEEFRVEQVVWGAAGLLAGVVVMLLLLARSSHRSPVPLLLLCLISAATGVLARDSWLTHQVREREQRMTAEFPTVAELLALAVSAGESPVGALERVTRLSRRRARP